MNDEEFREVQKHTEIGFAILKDEPNIPLLSAHCALSHHERLDVSKVSEEQLFYLMSRGLSAAEATQMIVMGFIEPFTKELPMEYAVEMNRLIKFEMEGSIG